MWLVILNLVRVFHSISVIYPRYPPRVHAGNKWLTWFSLLTATKQVVSIAAVLGDVEVRRKALCGDLFGPSSQ